MSIKRRMLLPVLSCALLLILFLPALAAEEGSSAPGTYNGFLYYKLENIGTRSEGPSYYLQQWDTSEIHIIKHGILWQHDAELDKYLNTKVTITGVMEDGQVRYEKIDPFKGL